MSAPSAEVTASEEEEGATSSSGEQRGNGKKKMRLQDIQEEESITAEYAQSLDLSCMLKGKGGVKPPTIDNGYVLKFNRQVLLDLVP